MNKKSSKIILFLGIVFTFLLKAGHALALELGYPTIGRFSITDLSTFSDYAKYFFNLGIFLAGLIAVISIAFGGISYLISFGSGRFTNEGKDWIKSGLLGLLIVVSAYLTSYTINPALVAFNFGNLQPINFSIYDAGTNTPPGATITTYQEIPIGNLTETLLTRTINCYGFDQAGDPVYGDQTKTDDGQTIIGTTYTDHDRIDCLLKLFDGAQKKAQAINALSKAIKTLMSTCTCDNTKCTPAQSACNNSTGACSCGGPCTKCQSSASCVAGPKNPTGDCCPTTDAAGKKLSVTVKDQIEHGPINVSISVSGAQTINTPIATNYYNENPIYDSVLKNTNIVLATADLTQSGFLNVQLGNINKNNFLLAQNAICKNDTDCGGVRHCNLSTGSCVDCVNNSQCGYGNHCNSSGSCVVGAGCNISADCAYGYHCAGGSCVPGVSCSDANPCAFGQHCDTVSGSCLPGASCNSDPDCYYPQKCTNGVCGGGTSCNSTPNCPSGQYCNTSIKLCVDCLNDSQCSAGQFCNNGLCLNSNTGTECTTKIDATYKGLDELRSQYNNDYNAVKNFTEKTFQINGKQTGVIDKNSWSNLRLVDQLVYFKGKIDEIKQTLQDDEDTLNKARDTLSKCYLAIPYVDLLKTYENTNQQQNVILAQRFADKNGDLIDASKYCKGFNYDNSSCLKKCNDLCPDTSPQAIQAYGACTDPTTQKQCITDAYNNKPCVNGPNTSQKFKDCISSCQTDCLNGCAKEDPTKCSDGYKICQNKCNSNSQCVLDNAGSCLFGAANFQQCAAQATGTDVGGTNYCINNAYSCKYGSSEYAGYSDCVDSTLSGCSVNEHSSSFLYDSFLNNNPGCEKCPYSALPPASGTTCYSSSNTKASCQELCPETTKCPSSSNCPACPCNQTDNQTLNFSVPTQTAITNSSCLWDASHPTAGNSTDYVLSQAEPAAYMVTGPQCVDYAFNDDPLTFYCQNNWESNPNREGLGATPIGQERVCPLADEVPVGQTVDSANAWFLTLMEPIKNGEQDIQNMIDFSKKIGDAANPGSMSAPNYCKCNATFENNNSPVCTTDCLRADSSKCVLAQCNGLSCQQMIDYLSKVSDYYRLLKLDYINFYTTTFVEPRSDIMKELTYSRQKSNSCSLTSSAYGAQTRLLDCTRVEDELIPPINTQQMKFNGGTFPGYCYGIKLGKYSNPTSSLTDNWFCCQQYTQSPGLNTNSIYNIQK